MSLIIGGDPIWSSGEVGLVPGGNVYEAFLLLSRPQSSVGDKVESDEGCQQQFELGSLENLGVPRVPSGFRSPSEDSHFHAVGKFLGAN